MNEYNTHKQFVILKEYGRNVQKLVDFIVTVEDREKRNIYAKTLIELMRQINPAMRDAQDYSQKLWDDLYIMSRFELDVDGPYAMPEKSLLGKKPKRMTYRSNDLYYKHYGRNVELLMEKAIEMENEADKENAIIYIGRLMKSFYSTWNKENVDDAVILEHMKEMSGNKLSLDLDRIRNESLFDSSFREKETRPERADMRNDRNDRGDRNDRDRGDRKNFKKPRRPDQNNNNNNNNNKRRKN